MNDSLAFGTAPTFECAAFAHVRGYLTTLTPLDLDANINFETTTIVLNISSNCSLLCSDASTELTTKWCTCSPHVLHDALAPFVQAAHSSAVSAALSVAMTGAYASECTFNGRPGLQVIVGTTGRSGNETAESDHDQSDGS